MKITNKKYACDKCGTVSVQSTNHSGQTYSWGLVNCCPSCPPHARPTIWECLGGMKLKMDPNGNLTLYVRKGLKIQTNGNLPNTHRDGITGQTVIEIRRHLESIKA